MPDPTTTPTDDGLARQLRAWADDLVDRIDPVDRPARPGRRPERRRLLAVAAVLLVLVAAAGVSRAVLTDDGEDLRATGPATEPSGFAALTGALWELDGGVSGGGEPVEVPPRLRATLAFRAADECLPLPDGAPCEDGPSLRGHDGCHPVYAALDVEGDGARPAPVTTVDGCPAPVGEVADVVRSVVTRPFRFSVDEDSLRVSSVAGTTVLTYRRVDVDRWTALAEDVTWQVRSVVDDGVALASDPEGTWGPSKVRFGRTPCATDGCVPDRVLTGTIACNDLGGRYDLTDNGFRSRQVAATEAGCDDAQADAFGRVLAGAPAVDVDPAGDRLLLTAGDTVVTLERGEDYEPSADLVVAVDTGPAYRVTVDVGDVGRDLVRVTLQEPASRSVVISERYSFAGAVLRGEGLHVVPVGDGTVVVGLVPVGAEVAVVDRRQTASLPSHPVEGVPDLAWVAGVLLHPPGSGCTVSTLAADRTVLGVIPC